MVLYPSSCTLYTLSVVLTDDDVRQLVAPFGLELSVAQVALVRTYLDVLLRWNTKINWTAIRTPEECVTRHFGESLYLARWVVLQGRLLDIGSGAGFPGLALKIAFPQLAVTLLEPVAKKRAFLKEVARICGMVSVDVRPERFQEFQVSLAERASAGNEFLFDVATARAVSNSTELVRRAVACVKPEGYIFLWLSHEQGQAMTRQQSGSQSFIRWNVPLVAPLSRQREIWMGQRLG